MELTQIVYIILVAVALLVIAYWVSYTRRLKTRPHVGTQEGDRAGYSSEGTPGQVRQRRLSAGPPSATAAHCYASALELCAVRLSKRL